MEIRYVACYLYCLHAAGSCAPADLHSFPTRRSSDLRELVNLAVTHVHPRRAGLQHRHERRVPREDADLAGCARDRSEEHTSELQSLRHLVCRLLLEKKN